MAGQGIQPSFRTATWFIKFREGSEFVYERCQACGESKPKPSHAVIRVNDEQFREWIRIGNSTLKWNSGITMSLVFIVIAFFGAFLGGAIVTDAPPTALAEVLLLVASLAVGGLAYFLTTHQMFRYNKRVQAERRARDVKFLKQFGGIDPDEVGTPRLIGVEAIKAVLVPVGIYEEVAYEDYLSARTLSL